MEQQHPRKLEHQHYRCNSEKLKGNQKATILYLTIMQETIKSNKKKKVFTEYTTLDMKGNDNTQLSSEQY